jgi:CMP-N,N'-diacetyllegionaminic acid synthase
MRKKIICFDIDGVLCSTKKNFYKKSKPKKRNILAVNNFYKKGFYIKIFTSRFMGRSNENIYAAKKKASLLTKKQLKKWGVKYHKLIFGKPSFDLYIDDKSLNFDKNWASKISKLY